jgi:hypothetical protein
MAFVDVTTVSLAIFRKSKFIYAKRLLVADSNFMQKSIRERKKREREREREREKFIFQNRLLVFSPKFNFRDSGRRRGKMRSIFAKAYVTLCL